MFQGKPKFNKETFALIIDISANPSNLALAELSSFEKSGYEKKDEFHVTILGLRKGRFIKEWLERNSAREEEVISKIETLINKSDWTFEARPEIYSISKNYPEGLRESVIQMVTNKEIKTFFEELSSYLGEKIEPSPLHVTLMTRGGPESKMGIGLNSWNDFRDLNPKLISEIKNNYHTIVLPTRPQPDTIISIFLLKKFGEDTFPGIKEAKIDFWQVLPEKETEQSLDKKGVILIDLGGGRFDHHSVKTQITASDLIAQYLGISDEPAIAKLIEYGRRDDFYGKGTISNDPIDRAFGLSSLIAALNKSLVKNPEKVVEIILPLIIAHYNEELKRTKELPLEFESKLAAGEAKTFEVRQRDKKLKVVVINSESGSLAGYLRSQNGGKFDVVAQWLPTNHVNILTRPAKRIDLRSLTALLRLEEATIAGYELTVPARELARYGRMKEIPEWYYDPATNSIQNGGLNPKEISPTKIDKERFNKILELGLSEEIWDPRSIN